MRIANGDSAADSALVLVADRRRRRAPARGARTRLSRRLVALGARARGCPDRAARALPARAPSAGARAGRVRRDGGRAARGSAPRGSLGGRGGSRGALAPGLLPTRVAETANWR